MLVLIGQHPIHHPTDKVAKCIRHYESRNHYRAQSHYSSASGAYQFVDGTWNNYKGYKRAFHAPPRIQDKKFRKVWNHGKGKSNWIAQKGRCF